MKNNEIIGITSAFAIAKKQAENGGGVTLPANVAWKRRLNMKDLFAVRETIIDAINEDKSKLDEILDQDTDVNIRKIKIEELGNCQISDIEMDTLAFMIEE